MAVVLARFHFETEEEKEIRLQIERHEQSQARRQIGLLLRASRSRHIADQVKAYNGAQARFDKARETRRVGAGIALTAALLTLGGYLLPAGLFDFVDSFSSGMRLLTFLIGSVPVFGVPLVGIVALGAFLKAPFKMAAAQRLINKVVKRIDDPQFMVKKEMYETAKAETDRLSPQTSLLQAQLDTSRKTLLTEIGKTVLTFGLSFALMQGAAWGQGLSSLLMSRLIGGGATLLSGAIAIGGIVGAGAVVKALATFLEARENFTNAANASLDVPKTSPSQTPEPMRQSVKASVIPKDQPRTETPQVDTAVKPLSHSVDQKAAATGAASTTTGPKHKGHIPKPPIKKAGL